MAIVRSLTETGLTLVIVEQSLSVACQVCERAVFMEKGEVRFEGRAADLLERDDIARAVFLGGHGAGSSDANGGEAGYQASTSSAAADESPWTRPTTRRRQARASGVDREESTAK
jgi:ABC-type multidrug transport system ATPase subunit